MERSLLITKSTSFVLLLTITVNGVFNNAAEMHLFQELIMLPAPWEMTDFLFSEVTTPLTKDSTIPTSSRLVSIIFLSPNFIANFQWSQPPNQKSGTEPKNTESKIGAPEPRANHTCTYHEGKVYVFGGHGGVSYQRKTFDDLYVLDCESFEWTKLEPNGLKPEPRGGHTAAVLPNDRILYYGGWSTHSQYANMFIYDIKKNEWIDPEIQYDIPRWNHSGVMVFAIPSWKYFIFGGSVGTFDEGTPRTLGKLTDDLHVLDIETMKWSVVALDAEDNKPKARESSAMFYDSNESRLIVFGGWNNNWLGDICSIPIGIITGPPYAIFDINPKLGPYTGHTKVTITGVGFVNTQNIIVRFTSGKASCDQQGFYVSDTEIQCDTPDFTAYGPKEAEVRIAIDRGDLDRKSVV